MSVDLLFLQELLLVDIVLFRGEFLAIGHGEQLQKEYEGVLPRSDTTQ